MLHARLDRPRTVLCLGAHADDIEVGCGGTLLHLLAAHDDLTVHWVVLSGEGERAEEARRGAELLLPDASRRRVVVERFRDSFFPYDGGDIKERLHAIAREVSPDLIFTHRREDLHQDHRLVSELTWNAFRDHLILEYEIPKYDGDLGQPNVYVPLTRELASRKVDTIIDTFQSQQGHVWFSPDTFWATMRLRGVECNASDGFAEGFHCRKMVF